MHWKTQVPLSIVLDCEEAKMKKQHGLSLVELMISITLGLVLMTGVVQMFVSSKDVYLSQKGMSRIQETGRLAMEFIGRDLRMASFYGCRQTYNRRDPANSPINDAVSANPGANGLSGLHMNFTEGLRGYNSGGNGAPLPNGAAVDLGVGFTVIPTDVLVIRGTGGGLENTGLPVSQLSTTTQVFGYTPDNALVNGCVEGLCNGGIAVITDCQKGSIFRITAPLALAVNKVTLTHALWPTPAVNVLTNEYSSGLILAVHTIVYFVAIPPAPAPQVPSLWQKIDTTPAQELLQGVENIAITYSQSNSPTVYSAASAVTNWNLVNSVRVELLARGLEQQNPTNETQPITFNNNPIIFNDGVVREVFKSTFAVRTRFQ
jgi:type IV pilus assembly protein PilW